MNEWQTSKKNFAPLSLLLGVNGPLKINLKSAAHELTKDMLSIFNLFGFPDSKLDPPQNWTAMSGSNVYELVPPSSLEYAEVSKAFGETCKRQIIKVGVSLSHFKPNVALLLKPIDKGCIWKFLPTFVSPNTALGNSSAKIPSRKHLLVHLE